MEDLTAAVWRRLEREPDVLQVIEMQPLDGGRFRYLIKTPFDTFPRFVIGTTDATLADVRIRAKCGAEWNAKRLWAEGQVAA
ncbi:MAG: hypothetical protein QOE70_4339 [Chthoniobacter sp.]|jgi:hypothetical protein|nr:hypothetical protein [Chthoniobacter sp.]